MDIPPNNNMKPKILRPLEGQIRIQKPSQAVREGSPLTEGIRRRPVINGIKKQWVWSLAGMSIVVIAVLVGLYIKSQRDIYELSRKVEQQQKDPAAQVKAETNSVLDSVGKLIVLPKDETPTIATVTDIEKLKGQAFFEKAQIGDKVIIYTKAKKAILYRPEENKIIELAPLNTGVETSTK